MTDAAPAPVTGESPSRLRAWIVGIRPASLSASIVPVLVGTGASTTPGHVNVPVFLVTLLAAVLIQIGTNFTNDVYDFRSGADSADRMGPKRLILSGQISPREAMTGAVVVFAFAAVLGIYLITVGGLPILIIGVLSIASAYLYTGGPWPLGYHGLGDVFAFTFFGLLGVTGTAYLQSHHLEPRALIASLPVGFIVTAILVVNNIRDIETDRAAGKMTLAVRIGRPATKGYYLALVLASYLVPLLLWSEYASGPWVLLSWLTLPLGWICVRGLWTLAGPPLNLMLKRTGQLNLAFGVLLALGLWFR